MAAALAGPELAIQSGRSRAEPSLVAGTAASSSAASSGLALGARACGHSRTGAGGSSGRHSGPACLRFPSRLSTHLMCLHPETLWTIFPREEAVLAYAPALWTNGARLNTVQLSV